MKGKKQIQFARPSLGLEEASAASDTILSGWVTQGPKVKEFEESYAEFAGSQFACAVSSCTTALQLALLAVGVQPGDIVITVSHSFIATANTVRFCGAEPVFVDIEGDTFNIDTTALETFIEEQCYKIDNQLFFKNVERLITGESPLVHYCGKDNPPNLLGRIAAIVPVHQMGIPADIKKLVNIARQYSLPLIEDSACATGSEVSFDKGLTWEKIGKPHGDIACFSFHPRKVLTTGDGGMITTNKKEYLDKFRSLRHHAMSVPDSVRHLSNKIIFEEYTTTAFNFRMTDIQAAVGIEQVKKADLILSKRHHIGEYYAHLLEDVQCIEAVKAKPYSKPNWQSYPVKLKGAWKNRQKELMQSLLERGVSSRRGVINIHQEPPYRGVNWDLPVSEECRDCSILLPMHAELKDSELEYVVQMLKEVTA